MMIIPDCTTIVVLKFILLMNCFLYVLATILLAHRDVYQYLWIPASRMGIFIT